MTIDLSQFVDKEVTVTLQNGNINSGVVRKYDMDIENNFYTHFIEFVGGGKWYYSEDGRYSYYHPMWYPQNIANIQLKNQPKPMTKLSNKTFQQLADTLTSDVIEYIHKDERYVLFMQEVIPDALSHMMGQLDDDLHFELSMAIMDRMALRTSK